MNIKYIDVIGHGGREDAICKKLSSEGHVTFKRSYTKIDLPEHKVADFVVVGPEEPLHLGIVDEYAEKYPNVKIVGPTKLAARLETSKLWAKQFMQRNNIPTPRWFVYDKNPDGMNQALIDLDIYRNNRPHKIVSVSPLDLENPYYPIVIKEDGLCGGKGVFIAKSKEEAWKQIPQTFLLSKFQEQSKKVLIEDFIEGIEASCFVLCDGVNYKILPYCKDYKKLKEGDKGPNTGGMGAVVPHPLMHNTNSELKNKIEQTIIKPTLKGMQEEGIPYKGILYIGLIIDAHNEPYVLEYNVRFGDPECQVLMHHMKSDLFPYLEAISAQNLVWPCSLNELPNPEFYDGFSMTVALCSKGYPNEYRIGKKITILPINNPNVTIHHVGLNHDTTESGRVMYITGRGNTISYARHAVYDAIQKISFEGMIYRTDIGAF